MTKFAKHPSFLKALALCALLGASSLLASPFSIDVDHTDVGFKIKHMQVSQVRGNFKTYKAIVEYDAKKGPTKLEASIDVASIDTNNETRNGSLRSPEFFDAKKYPKITFKMTKFVKKGKDGGVVSGTLNMHGVSKPIKLEFSLGGLATIDGKQKLGFTLSGVINRRDFNIAKDTSSLMLGDEVTLDIEVEADATK